MSMIFGLDLDFPKEYLKAALMVSLLSVWVLVGLFYYLNRYTKRRYFTIWTAAWLFYALWLTLGMSLQQVPNSPLLVMLKQWCLSAAAVFLLWGSATFLRVRTRQTMFGLFIAFLFVWSYVGSYHLEDSLQSQLPIFGLIGLASVMTGSCFYKFRRKHDYLGAGLLSFGFILWGFYMAGYPLIQDSDHLISAGFFVSAVLQLFIAVSMIVLVLEEVRMINRTAHEKIRSVNSEKHALETQVASTEERYRSLFEQASEGIVIVDEEQLRILELNPAAERLLGLKKTELSGQVLPFFCQWPEAPAVLPETAAGWFSLLREQRQFNVVRRDGGLTMVEAAGSQIKFDGRPACQFYFRELTERVRLEQQLRQAEKLSALGRMISGVAHELNNPLAVVKGYTELILATHDLKPQTRTDLQKVAHEGERAAKLVGNFLSYARENSPKREQVSLNDLVRRTAGQCELELKSKGVSLELELDPHLPKTTLNPDQVEQVLVNLVTNAQQAMAALPGQHHLKLSTQRIGELVQLSVEDNGTGVPEEFVGRIFEPFFTTKEVGKGTGLGLSLAHGTMADHHGRIFYRRASLGGAAFVLEFPLVEVDGEVAPRPVATQPAEPRSATPLQSAEGAGVSVLVLDDEQPLAEMLGEVLKMLGHKPVICFNPNEALERLSKEKYDVILSDFRMPGMNGEHFFQEVSARWPALAPRIVFLTGDLINDGTKHFLHSISNPHVSKPFNLTNVEEAVNKILQAETAVV